MSGKAPDRWTSAQLVSLLRERHGENEWVFLEQVREGTGFGNHRTADAIAMNLWPSRGLALHGFEVKVSRADWRRELVQPEKAEAIARVCDAWWIVAPKDVVSLAELPAGWGLLQASVVGAKPKLTAARAATIAPPEPLLDRSFVAAVLRRAREVVTDNKKLKAEYQRGFDEGNAAAGKVEADQVRQAEHREADLWERIQAFEKASGVHLNSWDAGHIGEVVSQVLHGESRLRQLRSELERAHAQWVRIVEGLAAELARDGPT